MNNLNVGQKRTNLKRCKPTVFDAAGKAQLRRVQVGYTVEFIPHLSCEHYSSSIPYDKY